MKRWDELIALLMGNDITERQAAMAVSEQLSKGRGKNLAAVDELQAAIARWRIEDRAKEGE